MLAPSASLTHHAAVKEDGRRQYQLYGFCDARKSPEHHTIDRFDEASEWKGGSRGSNSILKRRTPARHTVSQTSSSLPQTGFKGKRGKPLK